MSGDEVEQVADSGLLQMRACRCLAVIGRHAEAQPARDKCVERIAQPSDRLLRRCYGMGVKTGKKRGAVLVRQEAQDFVRDFGRCMADHDTVGLERAMFGIKAQCVGDLRGKCCVSAGFLVQDGSGPRTPTGVKVEQCAVLVEDYTVNAQVGLLSRNCPYLPGQQEKGKSSGPVDGRAARERGKGLRRLFGPSPRCLAKVENAAVILHEKGQRGDHHIDISRATGKVLRGHARGIEKGRSELFVPHHMGECLECEGFGALTIHSASFRTSKGILNQMWRNSGHVFSHPVAIMSGHILIVEPTTSQRIRLRALVAGSYYQATSCRTPAEALARLAEDRVDLVLLDVAGGQKRAFSLIASIRERGATSTLPVIALTADGEDDARISALRAGADDVLAKGGDPALLLARIRNLLRVRDTAAALRLDGGAARALGMAETARVFVPAGRTVIVTRRPSCLPPPLAALAQGLPGPVVILSPEDDFFADDVAADLFVIDHETGLIDHAESAALFHLIADLQSRPATHHAKVLVTTPESACVLSRMALDLGADDVVPATVGQVELAVRVRALLRRKSQADCRRGQVETGLAAALTDPLTGLFNRRYITAELDLLIERHDKDAAPWSIILLDIDHFKNVNDTFGHSVGDKVLREVALRLRARLRRDDLIARIGGEELLVVLPTATGEQARLVAERLRRLVATSPVIATRDGTDIPVRITLSAGVAEGRCPGERTGAAERLLEQADRALYAAKASGRNRVTVSAPADAC